MTTYLFCGTKCAQGFLRDVLSCGCASICNLAQTRKSPQGHRASRDRQPPSDARPHDLARRRERLSKRGWIAIIPALMLLDGGMAAASAAPLPPQQRMVEWTTESKKVYADPFNDVDVDVIFSKGGQTWRVPAFWHGGQRWTVRFAPPVPGDYTFRLESTDKRNPDLNGHAGHVTINGYTGTNKLLQHGMPQVSSDKRHFEHADGTPFFWLGDTLWTGLSDRLSWEGFRTLVADRKEKGFTVVQISAGLVPNNEELPPVDPGFINEGGAVWDPQFQRINPQYFDYADRRIQLLVDAGITPAIFGGWWQVLKQMGVDKMKKHWRYVIARYGSYPVFWVVGGELFDPPEAIADRVPEWFRAHISPGWTEVARYVRATDPYHHPLAAHEAIAPFDIPLKDSSLTDFEMTQPCHLGWASIGSEIAQLNQRYARIDTVKPLVVGEIGYELRGATHLEDFQRVAFWSAVLNGAAGYTYGAAPTFEANNPDKPFHRSGQVTFLTWQEGMNLPGSYQVGLSKKFLQQFQWWRLAPHPEWVIPRGTTLLEPHRGERAFDPASLTAVFNDDFTPTDEFVRRPETVFPGGEWKAHDGNFRWPYAAGISGSTRIIYIPYFPIVTPPPPTILDLEHGVRYQAYYWEPMLGIKFDLGEVELPPPGNILIADAFENTKAADWSEQGSSKAMRNGGKLIASGETISIVDKIKTANVVAAVDGRSDSSAALVFRYRSVNDYIAATYSPSERSLYLVFRSNGVNSKKLGVVPVSDLGANVHLSAEVRENMATASITDGNKTYSTPIIDLQYQDPDAQPRDLSSTIPGAVGLLHQGDGRTQSFDNFEVRESPSIAQGRAIERKLYDARGQYRGELNGSKWEEFGIHRDILLNSYRPERFPAAQDWLLVLQVEENRPATQ
jgi:uncharacterized protein DUF4038/uncharacterized protein DUF5060